MKTRTSMDYLPMYVYGLDRVSEFRSSKRKLIALLIDIVND